MREIIFRGKSINTNNWVFGSLVYSAKEKQYYIVEQQDDELSFPVYEESIGQFTGLTDRYGYGQKIFEDDFLIDDSGFVYRVVYENGALCLVAATKVDIPYDTLPKELLIDEFDGSLADNIVSFFALKWNHNYWYEKFEVIGNIHDNPELLEVQE